MPRVETTHGRWRAGIGSVGLLGVLGGLTCTVTMVAPVVGIAGAGAAAGMNGMSSSPPGGVLGVLTGYGPGILIVSVLLVTASLTWRRAFAAVPALAAGVLLYWGMYAQSSYPVMYLSLGLGFAVWIATYLWTRTTTTPTHAVHTDDPRR